MPEEHPERSIPATGPSPADPSGLKGLTVALGIEPAQPGQDPLLGSVVGGVTILRVIADGGMGRVYEGRQDKPRRAVAVKVMRPGFTSASMTRRFQYEAEVLGRLQHPGIAHIYAAAMHTVAGSEVPYFVMEYIRDAKPLTEYVTHLSLPTRARLELFRTVCQAVAHGHQKGVIHRDLKPNNILVDGAGQAKVIDFGVARATDSDMALTTMQTDIGQLIGTLQYMSPEQFEADPNNIDIRSDVYALGVILYELLAGQPPYDLNKKALLEVARVVRECEPTPISQLNKTLCRDLGVIAGKCLHKDRGHRYSSAAELADEISRHLAGAPIIATPPRVWDTVVRLSRRHKIAALALASIATFMLVAVVCISVFAVVAVRAREDADRQRLVANQARAAAEQARDAAIQSREAEAQQRDRAETESVKAKERLFSDDLRRLARARESGQSTAVSELYATAIRNYRNIYGDKTQKPLALRLLGQIQKTDALHELTHADNANAVAFSPDGKRLASTHGYKSVVVWDAITGKSILEIKRTNFDNIESLAFNSNGSQILAASSDGVIYIWNSVTGTLSDKQQVMKRPPIEISLGLTVVFSLNGNRSAWAVTNGSETTISVWDVIHKRAMAAVTIATGERFATAPFFTLSPDGRCLLTSSEEQGVRILDAETGAQKVVLESPDSMGIFSKVVMALDGTRVVQVGNDGIRCWDGQTGKMSGQVLKSWSGFDFLALSPAGDRVAVAPSDGGHITICDTTSGADVANLSVGGAKKTQLTDINAFSVDGSRLATTHMHDGVRVWNTSSDESLTSLVGHQHGITAVAFSHDGSRIATGSLDGSTRLWDSATYQPLAVLQGPRTPILWLAFSPDGTRLATATMNQGRLWDAITGEAVAELKEHTQQITSLAFSSSAELVATASNDQTSRLWNAITGECIATLKGHRSTVTSLAFSNTHPRLATTTYDGPVGLWDTVSRQPVALIKGDQGPIESLAFSPRQPILATASEGGTRLWDAITGAARGVIPNCPSRRVTFSPNGVRLAILDTYDRVKIWDIPTWTCVAITPIPERVRRRDLETILTLDEVVEHAQADTEHAEATEAVELNMSKLRSLERAKILAFSPDSSLLAIGEDGETIKLWDTVDGYLIAELSRPTAATALAFHPEGLSVVACSLESNTAIIYGSDREEIHRNRVACRAVRSRLAKIVEEWFGGDLASVKAKLNVAKTTMTPEDYREVANIVLMRANANGLDMQ